MKKKYCFLRDAEKLQPDSVVFCLFIGSSRRDQVKKTLLECFANDIGAFFRQWDEDTDFYLESLAKNLRPQSKVPLLWVKKKYCSISDFYRTLQDKNIEIIEREVFESANRFIPFIHLDLQFYRNHIKKQVIHRAPSERRKYLSHDKGSELSRVCLSFLLIIGLFLVAAWIEGVERGLL